MEAVTTLSEATALLIIRVVVERGSSVPLRAYIRDTDDISLGFEHVSTVVDVEAALAVVRAWLERALDPGAVGEAVVPARPL
jgi:hypothetical protein